MISLVRSAAALRAAVLMLFASLALAGCQAGRSSNLEYAPASFNVPPDDIFAAPRDHRLGPSDLVGVSVYRVPDLTGDFRVDPLGNIMIPLIGQIPVQGMTLTELTAEITRRLEATYYRNPDVSVALRETPNRTITVDGAVAAPGAYPVLGRTTLMQAIALARGVTQDANLRRVVIFRQVQGQRMAAGFDLQAIRQSEMEDPVLYPSDIIVVDGSNTRQLWRDVISTIPILALFRPLVI